MFISYHVLFQTHYIINKTKSGKYIKTLFKTLWLFKFSYYATNFVRIHLTKIKPT